MARFFTKDDDRLIKDAWETDKATIGYGETPKFDAKIGAQLGRSPMCITYRRHVLGLNMFKQKKHKGYRINRKVTLSAPTAPKAKACYCRYCGERIE